MTREKLILRKPLWKALSNFYLDTELDETDYVYISKTLIETRIELTELKEIDLYEVYPTLQMNLLSPVGVWDGFEDKWLFKQCLINHTKRLKSKPFMIYTRFKNKLHYWMRKKHWEEIDKRMQSV